MFKLLYMYFIFSIYNAQHVYKSYQDKIVCHPETSIQTPRSLTELRNLVTKAIDNNSHIKVVGSRHSVTDVICTDGIPIHLKYFNKVTIDKQSMTATLGTGLELTDAMDALHKEGYTIKRLPTFGSITVGGAIALGAHGSSLKYPTSVSEYLVAVTIIDGNGELKKVDDTQPEFDSFRVSLGQLGVVIDATFNIVPQFKMKVSLSRIKDDILINNPNELINIARTNDFLELYWFPSNRDIVISKGNHIPTSYKGNAHSNMLTDISPPVLLSYKIFYDLAQSTNSSNFMKFLESSSEGAKMHSNLIFKMPVFTESGSNKFVNPATGYGYRLMSSRCKKHCPWEYIKEDNQAFTLSLDKFANVVKDLRYLLDRYPIAFSMTGLMFRFSPASKGVLSLSSQQDSFHIDWAYPISLDPFNHAPYGLSAMQALSQLLLNKYNARPHWGKNGLAYFTHDIISKRYSESSLNQFRDAVEKYDPNGLFRNNFGNRLLGIGKDKIDIPSQVKHCALQDYCICKKDSDCSDKCGRIMNYNVCLQNSALINIRL